MDGLQPRPHVAVIGLGYVGLPLAVSFARAGVPVIGVDIDPAVREAIAARGAPFFEPGLTGAIRSLPPGMLTVTARLPDPVPAAVIISVGTTVDPVSRRPDLGHLVAAVDEVAGRASADTLVVVRSTVPVGTCREVVLSRLRHGPGNPTLACCPERIIQGSALAELTSLPQIIGGVDDRSANHARALFGVVAPDQIVVSSLEAAEMIKLICNAHTDLIYGFGNEVALAASGLGLDARELIESANLRYPRPDLSRPGFVGGSCLTKDPYLLMHSAGRAGYHPPMVAAARQVNERVPGHVAERVLDALAATDAGRPAAAKILVCGIAYKGRPETDDVRGSAAAEVAKILGHRVAVLVGHDPRVRPERVAGLGYKPMSLQEGLTDADALILLSDHAAYQELTADTLRHRMKTSAVVFDMWGALDAELTGAAGIEYLRFGRG